MPYIDPSGVALNRFDIFLPPKYRSTACFFYCGRYKCIAERYIYIYCLFIPGYRHGAKFLCTTSHI